ncbi:hypothetical protein ACQ1Z2_14660, partial [Enterococcus faecalis]|uniref:hypothetical protein n=1 Tax=Enterococcus faecalis TaxID=1351 RepID=UPI003D6AF54D
MNISDFIPSGKIPSRQRIFQYIQVLISTDTRKWLTVSDIEAVYGWSAYRQKYRQIGNAAAAPERL